MITIPTESVSPGGYDFGQLSEQGRTNQKRIEKLEEKVGQLEGTINTIRGMWLVAASVFGGTLTVFAYLARKFGKEVISAIGAHYGVRRHTEGAELGQPPPGQNARRFEGGPRMKRTLPKK
jgi:hypothetical protein